VNTAQTFFDKHPLPLFLTKANQWTWIVATFALASILYLTSNHIQIVEPRFLPMTWIDRNTPFIAESIWIYTSEYYLFLAVVLAIRDSDNLNRYLYSFLGLQIFCVAIFWIWPTVYPRELFALNPHAMDPLTYYAFNSLRMADTAANCCPSLHVSSVYLSAFVFLRENKTKFWIFSIWATFVAASTLTTKQHYLIDVVTGFICAVFIYQIFYNFIRYRRLHENT
jgi:membrane-associated phospholipid phosphatase